MMSLTCKSPKLSALKLILLLTITVSLNGCATRALMSSDRYEKPASSQWEQSQLETAETQRLAALYDTQQASNLLD
jgi:outer membrane lipoprotein SlyB